MDKKRFELIEPGIYKNKVRGNYTISFSMGRDDKGKEKKISETLDTLGEARIRLAKLRIEKEESPKVNFNDPTIDDLMKDFRETYIDINTEKTTSFSYKVIEKHVGEFFDKSKINRHVDKITGTTIDKYYSYLLNIKTKRNPDGLSYSTVRKHRDYLRMIFDYAVKHDDVYKIKTNPVNKSTLPKGRRSEIKKTPDLSWYNTDNIPILIDKLLETEDYPFICGVLLALMGGLRRGEMEYLKWSDVDLETGIIHVRGSRTTAGGVVEKDITKTGTWRTTSLSKIVVDALIELKKSQEYYKSILGKEYIDSDYVIVKPNGENYDVKYFSTKFKKFLERNGFPHIRYHDLRHINASILLQIIPLADVSKHLGHSTPNTTSRIYAHSLMRDQRGIAQTMDGVFGF